MMLIAVFVILAVLLVGLVYDQVLGLWKEQRTVDTERNPFGTYALIPANTVIVGMLNRVLRESAGEDEKVQETCDWVDEWLAWCSKQEIWARSQKFWDTTFDNQVPDLFFMPEGAIESARAKSEDIEE